MSVKFKAKDYIAIGLVSVLSFPLLYLIMLFATGTARIEFNTDEKANEENKKVEMMQQNIKRDSLSAVNSRTFTAIQKERTEIEQERARLMEQQKRMELLQQEIQAQSDALKKEREKIEGLVTQSDSLNTKKLKDLSKVYGAMRPAEAAKILETLPDKLSSQIISSINDDRQKAKILSSLPKNKANKISKILAAKN